MVPLEQSYFTRYLSFRFPILCSTCWQVQIGLPITGKYRDPESDQYYNNNDVSFEPFFSVISRESCRHWNIFIFHSFSRVRHSHLTLLLMLAKTFNFFSRLQRFTFNNCRRVRWIIIAFKLRSMLALEGSAPCPAVNNMHVRIPRFIFSIHYVSTMFTASVITTVRLCGNYIAVSAFQIQTDCII